MPKILCKCSHPIYVQEIPNPNEWLLISDQEFDKFQGRTDTEELYRTMKSMLVCPSCKRILIFWNGWNSAPSFYSEEV